MLPPRAVLLMLFLVLVYLICNKVFDRDSEQRPLENPYPLIQHLDRDGHLRTAFFGEQALLRRRGMSVHYDFETEGRSARAVIQTGLRAEWRAESLMANGGCLQLTPPVPTQGIEFHHDLRITPHTQALVLSGRVRLLDSERDTSSLAIDLRLQNSLRASGPTRTPETLIFQPLSSTWSQREECVLFRPSLQVGEWLDVEVGIPLPHNPAPTWTLLASVQFQAQTLQWDELTIREGSRIEGLVAAGHPRGIGSGEATRELKRFVLRGDEERLCLALPGATVLTYEFELPPEPSVLEFGVTAGCLPDKTGSTELAVAISREGEFEEPLLRTHVTAADVSSFRDHQLDLSRFAGALIRLQFRVTENTAVGSPLLFLANPLLHSPPSIRTPHVLLLSRRAGNSPEELTSHARLRDQGITLQRGIAPTDDPHLNLLCTMTSLPPPTPLRREGNASIMIPRHQPTLAEVLRVRGYRCFAAPSQSRIGWLLQGFYQRTAQHSQPIAALLEALDRTDQPPLFAFLELQQGQEDRQLQELLRGLEDRHALEQCLLALIVDGNADKDSAEYFLRLPGAAHRQQTATRAFSLLDLGPTLLRLLDLPAAKEFRGRGFSIDELLNPSLEPATGIPAALWTEDEVLLLHTEFVTRLSFPSSNLPVFEVLQPSPAPTSDLHLKFREESIRRGVLQPTPLLWVGKSLPLLELAVIQDSRSLR